MVTPGTGTPDDVQGFWDESGMSEELTPFSVTEPEEGGGEGRES